MKLIVSSLDNGNLKHKEIELPDRFLNISLELESGMIFQLNVNDAEDSIDVREVTFRHIVLEPKAANTITVKGI